MKYNLKELETFVQKAKEGDNQAFVSLYEKSYQQTYFLAYSMLKNKEDAQDAAQEAYTNVHINLSKLEHNKTFIAWINRITYNICLRMCEKNKSTDDVDINSLLDERPAHNPVHVSILKSKKQILAEFVHGLDEPLKVTIILMYYQNLKIKEIAHIMNCPEGTVKSRLTTAKKLLKKNYKKEEKVRFCQIPLFYSQ